MFRGSLILSLLTAVLAGALAFGLPLTRGNALVDVVFIVAAGVFIVAVVRAMADQIRAALEESVSGDLRARGEARAEVSISDRS